MGGELAQMRLGRWRRLRLEGRVVELVQARGGGDANDQLRRKSCQ